MRYILAHVKYILYIEGISPPPCLDPLTEHPSVWYNGFRNKETQQQQQPPQASRGGTERRDGYEQER